MDNQWSPQINLGVSVLIPETYVSDLDVRLGLYRRLSNLNKKVEFEGFAAELIDRFGKLPSEVNTLLLVVRIKSVCKKAASVNSMVGLRELQFSFTMISLYLLKVWLNLLKIKMAQQKSKITNSS